MPSDGFRIGAFVLFYEYIRLDIVGTLPALEDFLHDARDNGREEPIQYFLNVPGTEERRLGLTRESQRVWELLIGSNDLIGSMQHSDQPMQFTSFPPLSDPEKMRLELLISAHQAMEEFVFFITHSTIGPAYKLSLEASFPDEPLPEALVPGAPFRSKFTHRYAPFLATHLQVQCILRRPSTPIGRLLALEVDPHGLLETTNCQNQECYKYTNEVENRTQWNVTVSALDRTQRVKYRLQGIPGVKGEFVFDPFKP